MHNQRLDERGLLRLEEYRCYIRYPNGPKRAKG